MDEIIRELIRLGWTLDGKTREQTVRLPTGKGPVLNGMANTRIAHFGGRVRLSKGRWFVTVGKRSTCFYSREPLGGTVVKSDLQTVIAAEQQLQRTSAQNADAR